MIRKLKIKFTALAMVALFSLLAIVVSAMNIVNYNEVLRKSDRLLNILSQNNVTDMKGRLPYNMSLETLYESRYFTVVIDDYGNVLNVNTGRIEAINDDSAVKYARKIIRRNKEKGFINDYRYSSKHENGEYNMIFLDCGRRLKSYYDFLQISILFAVAGLAVSFCVISIFAGKIIKPIAESYDKQKQFITDAGHEIKTPLTIINANIDILEAEIGENESLTDISQQTRRLRSLTDDLVLLARIEEQESTMPKIDFPVSEVVTETIMPFKNIALQQNKKMFCNIQPMVSAYGNAEAVTKLVNIFIDNAFKYSPDGGHIRFDLTVQGQFAVIHTYNATKSEITPRQISRVFERFYRTDSSRNSESGGSGIGLSVAKAIVNAHGGKIQAWTNDNRSFEISAALPMYKKQ